VRAAEAFGATGVVFLKGAVSPHNPKTLRASAGSLLPRALRARRGRRHRHRHPASKWSEALCRHAARFHPEAASLAATGPQRPLRLVVGNEARGVAAEWLAAAAPLAIPTVGVESLNAALAAGILLYEARRQRMLPR